MCRTYELSDTPANSEIVFGAGASSFDLSPRMTTDKNDVEPREAANRVISRIDPGARAIFATDHVEGSGQNGSDGTLGVEFGRIGLWRTS